MGLETKQLVIEKHAYERYCERVELISRKNLHALISEQLHDPGPRKSGYIQLGGVWWRYSVTDDRITLHTCYGRHHIDLPAAIRWAKRYRDRIILGN